MKLGSLGFLASATGCDRSPEEVVEWAFPKAEDLELGELQLAWDGEGRMFEIRPSLHQVARLDDNLDEIWTVGGDDVQDGGLNYPVAVVSTANGSLILVERGGSRLSVYDHDGNFDRFIGEPGDGDGQLSNAQDAVVGQDGRIYVADTGNHRVSIFTADGSPEWSFGGFGDGEGLFNGPRSLAFDREGYLHVLDAGNQRVQVFHPGGTWVRQYGSHGRGDGGLILPRSISVDPLGNAWIADPVAGVLQVFDREGRHRLRLSELVLDGLRIQPLRVAMTPDQTFYIHANVIRES